ncbi:alpha/beta hydrolase family protein [Nocardiopsis sp. JB363]|uniref:alpha/beta hydrolase n=1 Tax=Nocardiopsis sp. JB363 TaxID=1434837 RepID=UPI00097B2AB8|nr:alpha/beta hydrolase-fold protein [Nocardiopsis sp. JB363]SIO87778.1 putative esterase [Nocardiopsis sp. JB363]
MSPNPPSRRALLKSVGGLSVGLAVTSGGLLSATSAAHAAPSPTNLPAPDHAGLHLVDHDEADPRMWYYRFETDEIGWNPGVNVLVPEGYRDDGRTYPVLYLFHGGGPGSDFISWDRTGIRELSQDKQIIIVMPDGGPCGWYSNPVTSNVGPRNWETFHMNQVLPWVDANFRTHAEFDGRAVAGFSMGGFGALKYAAKYYGDFASVSSYSGPASMRRDFGVVTHWANFTSAAFELGGGMVYGAPWDEARVSADNAVENIDRYRDKRVFLVAGDSPDPFDLFDRMNEEQVLAGQREFRAALDEAGIPHDSHEPSGGHFVRPDLVQRDLDGMIEHLRSAG